MRVRSSDAASSERLMFFCVPRIPNCGFYGAYKHPIQLLVFSNGVHLEVHFNHAKTSYYVEMYVASSPGTADCFFIIQRKTWL